MRSARPWQSNRSRVLRANSTSAEDQLWAELRNRQLGGFKFVRQAAIAPYFVDFLCRELNVIVEVDGGTHSTVVELDADYRRSVALEAAGYRLFRVHNTEVFEALDGVLDELLALLQSLGE
jgi:very-short-patch-repair endonuclease